MSTSPNPIPEVCPELGIEVPVSKIDLELRKLWEQDEARTNASLMNLVVYSEKPGALIENSAIIRELTREHACRALLVALVSPHREKAAIAALVIYKLTNNKVTTGLGSARAVTLVRSCDAIIGVGGGAGHHHRLHAVAMHVGRDRGVMAQDAQLPARHIRREHGLDRHAKPLAHLHGARPVGHPRRRLRGSPF